VKAIGAKALASLIFLALVGSFAWLLYVRLSEEQTGAVGRGGAKPVPVDVSDVRHGPMESKRVFSGTIEARAQFVVAPKVGGRIEKLYVDLADRVSRGQLAAELDNAEYQQAVAQAEADVEVAKANLGAARSAVEISNRELMRVRRLLDRGLATDTEFDTARAIQLANQAGIEVATASLRKAESVLETSRIQLGYTRVTADWSDGKRERIVAERFVDEGGTVAANAPLLRIVELDPVTAVIFATEKDYSKLRPGQKAVLANDAYPGESFPAQVERIAPVFREATRQARVELSVENSDLRLKPGMFIRATVVLERVENTDSVPEVALTNRDGRRGVFLISAGDAVVSWRPVEIGIQEDDFVQIRGDGLEGKVVTLGQQFLDDGSPVSVAD